MGKSDGLRRVLKTFLKRKNQTALERISEKEGGGRNLESTSRKHDGAKEVKPHPRVESFGHRLNAYKKEGERKRMNSGAKKHPHLLDRSESRQGTRTNVSVLSSDFLKKMKTTESRRRS